MRRLPRRTWIPIALLLPAVAVLTGRFGLDRGTTPPSPPPPTEHVLRKDAEKENRIKREAWIESLHRAAPGVDWRRIEEENRAALSLERQALVDRGFRTQHWSEIGSANLAGRTHTSAYAAGDRSLYVGSDLGGVWKGNLAGENWRPISDGLGRGSHNLLVVPGSPEVLLTITDGGTCHATTNGGASWFVPAGLPEYSLECVRMVRDLGSPRTVYLLVKGAAFVSGSWRYGWHICRSTDGGLTFAVTYTETGYSNRCDIWINRINAGPLYLMVRNTLKVSTNQGQTFTVVGSSPDVASDVVLTGSEAGAPTFYAALNINNQWKLYRSTDAGATWAWRHNINDFWKTCVASIRNANTLYYAGVECFRSTSGGLMWTKVNNWWDYYGDPVNRLHADHPGGECMVIDDQEVFFLNTDGGTYVSYDAVSTVRNISLYGLGISQYYTTFTSGTHPYLIAAGSQDQGYQVSVPGDGTPYMNFIQHLSGDYGHLTSTARDHNYLYSVYPGFILLQVSEENPSNLAFIDFPSGASHSWMPFIQADPIDPDRFYFCADYLWRYQRTGGTTYAMSRMDQNFAPGYTTAIGISRQNPNTWFVATSQGRLWYSHDAGQTWTQSSTTGPGSHYFYGTALICSPTDPLVAYVGGSGYSNPAVYKTTDGGITWNPMGSGLPNTLVFGLALDNETDQNLYAAAEAGPYRWNRDTARWESILGTEAPLTVYWCVESVPELNVIRYGTYGRGIWDYRIVNPADATDAAAATARIAPRLFPNPATSAATVSFDLPRAGRATIEVFDVTGRRLATLLDEERSAGTHSVGFTLRTDQGLALRNGTYLVRVASGGDAQVAKMRVVR